ncbi:hypothetical protein ACVITL_001814 [Rhizobium pisi]
MHINHLPAFAMAVLVFFSAEPASTQALVAREKNWGLYQIKGTSTCYALTVPAESKEVAFLFSRENSATEGNFRTHLKLKSARMTVGGQKFSMFVKRGDAWFRNVGDGKLALRSMLTNANFTVSVEIRGGERVAYTFSTDGLSLISAQIGNCDDQIHKREALSCEDDWRSQCAQASHEGAGLCGQFFQDSERFQCKTEQISILGKCSEKAQEVCQVH